MSARCEPPPEYADRRCETCLHWQSVGVEAPEFGDCLWAGPVPPWVMDSERHDGMMATDGKDCLCWQHAPIPDPLAEPVTPRGVA